MIQLCCLFSKGRDVLRCSVEAWGENRAQWTLVLQARRPHKKTWSCGSLTYRAQESFLSLGNRRHLGLHPSFLDENLYLQGQHPRFMMMKKNWDVLIQRTWKSEFSEILLPFGGSKIQGRHFAAVWKSFCLSFLSKGGNINLSHGAAVRFKIMNPAWRPAQGIFGNIYRFDVLGKLIAASSFRCPLFEAV